CVAGCAPSHDEKAATTSDKLDSRFDADTPASIQYDAWSCSVHTTYWMLAATGNAVSYADVVNRMTSRGRVTSASGLQDSGGSGVVATLSELASGEPEVNNAPYVSFDDIAARAGRMAVGIGGRGWNHWSGVRGYDIDRDVILLANPAPGWYGVGSELDRGE